MSLTVSIRDLTIDDLSAIAKLHQSVFYDNLLTKMGIEVVRRYYQWQLVGPHDVVAVGAFTGAKDTLVGFCFGGVFQGALTGFLRRNRFFLIWRTLTHLRLILNPAFRERINLSIRLLLKRPKRLSTSKDDSRVLLSKTFCVLSIVTDQHYQHHGIGRMLMECVESIARKKGFKEMCLTVHPENYAAVRFYEDLGWRRTPQGKCWQGSMKKLIRPGPC